jgi:LmbE family N-acetylglucosaminyl deacetylase
MHWVYLSPHFDDAVLSCGGMIWEQVRSGDVVEIWTVCAASAPPEGDLPEFARLLHAALKAPEREVSRRRGDDRAACAQVGAVPRYGRLADCIYRRLPSGAPLIVQNDDLWLPVHPGEAGLVGKLARWMRRSLPREANLVCPLTLGNHTDHRLVRSAAESLKRELYYYADFPYSAQGSWAEPGLAEEGLYRKEVSPEGLRAWQEGIAAYGSQAERLFGSLGEMRVRVEEYWKNGGGSVLWKVG